MLEPVKYCEICGVEISNMNNPGTNLWRHQALMYCPECRKLSDKQKTLARVHKLRKKKKEKDKLRDEELELMKEKVRLLTEENELLRIRNQRDREQINQQSKSIITQVRKRVK